eukprot:CAMPEP_0168255924 /NCGR_PEP_ID=MMETSP0141_2-20121125/5529_1 /TAXON_ID=44445 /ORGANISM="Pseudo-nitzschia australis, Strain 10249 10 AB" /LENGTH=96 /DNA_ID=CAMNT_0008192487 /DNA_START=194 /DNA_END=481 /DNA_ORIENTATION=+
MPCNTNMDTIYTILLRTAHVLYCTVQIPNRWSRLAMAWCWGMYVNGIAVYGRDPVLTCEYAYFLTIDNRCPYISCYLEGLADVNNTSVKEMVPVDW